MKKILREIAAAVLIFAVTFGMVYAVTWILQGRITTKVTVEQWVLVDDRTMYDDPSSLVITENVSATHGFTSYGSNHWLKLADAANKVLVVRIDSEQAPDLYVFQEFKLIEPNDDVRFTNTLTTWEDFKSISFQYLVKSGSLYTPHVNVYLDNNALMTTWTLEGIQGGEIGVWKTVTYTKEQFYSYNEVSPAGGKFGPKYGFTIESYDIDYDDSTSRAAPQVVWFRNVVAYNTADQVIGITGIRLVPHDYLPVAGCVVDFRIGYYPTAGIGSVMIKTDINLIGEAEAGFYP